MNIAIFEYSEAKQYFIDDDNMIWMHGTLLAKRLNFNNPSEAITMHTDEDERRKIEIDGRLVWFVSEPGVWGMILAAKTNEAKEFKRQLKHDILPKLRSQGYYITQTDAKTLTALEVKVSELRESNKLLEASTEQAKREAKNASIAVQKFLRYFFTLNRFARELRIDLCAYQDIEKVKNKSKEELEQMDYIIHRTNTNSLSFIRDHVDTIDLINCFLCARDSVVNPESATYLIEKLIQHIEKHS